jgi:hypothetical protein
VSVALGELAGERREGLLTLAVGTGLQVMAALTEADVTAVCGSQMPPIRPCGRAGQRLAYERPVKDPKYPISSGPGHGG